MANIEFSLDSIFGFYQIDKGDDFNKSCSSYLMDKENKDIRTFFNAKQYRISDKLISYRLINFWESEGLIKGERGVDNKGWRQYSLMDIVWLQIIIRLRHMGFALSDIKKSKATLSSKIYECEHGELEFYTALAYFERTPVYALFFSNFKGEAATLYEILDSSEKHGILDHISININAILQSIFPNKNFQPVYKNFKQITNDDDEILDTIKKDKVEEVKLNIKDGKPITMSYVVDEPIDSNVGVLKNKNSHQKIEVTQHNSRTTNVKRIISKKFNKDE